MKFYTLNDDNGEVMGCKTTVADLRKLIPTHIRKGRTYTITRMEVPVNPQSICLLISGWGGYATETKDIETGYAS